MVGADPHLLRLLGGGDVQVDHHGLLVAVLLKKVEIIRILNLHNQFSP